MRFHEVSLPAIFLCSASFFASRPFTSASVTLAVWSRSAIFMASSTTGCSNSRWGPLGTGMRKSFRAAGAAGVALVRTPKLAVAGPGNQADFTENRGENREKDPVSGGNRVDSGVKRNPAGGGGERLPGGRLTPAARRSGRPERADRLPDR